MVSTNGKVLSVLIIDAVCDCDLAKFERTLLKEKVVNKTFFKILLIDTWDHEYK